MEVLVEEEDKKRI